MHLPHLTPSRPGALLAALVALALAAAGCSEAGGGAAATVDGAEISVESLEGELEAITSNAEYLAGVEQQFQLPSAGQGEGTYDTAFVANLLTLRVYYELVERELERRDAGIDDADLDAVREETVQSIGGEEVFDGFPAAYQDRLVRQRALLVAIEEAFLPQLEEGAAEAFYDENVADFEERCLAHILVGTTEGGAGDSTPEEAAAEADQIAADLAGGADFTEIASSAANDDTTSAAQGGSLDCATRATAFDPVFLEAAFAAEVGEVTAPIETQFGYHLILVSSAEVQPFEEVQAQIERQLQQADAGAFDEFLRAATCEGDIDVSDRYGSWDTAACETGGIGAVTPPSGPTTTTTLVPNGTDLLDGGVDPDAAGG